jgi:predicted Zn-dependent protease
MAILTKDEAFALMKKVLSYSKADECEINLTGTNTSNIRYARNAVSTSGAVNQTSLVVSSALRKEVGDCDRSMNTMIASLEKVVRRAEELAKLAPENPEYVPFLGPQTYGESHTYSAATAALTPALRAQSLKKA